MPIWLRDSDRRLVWVNAAYAAAVEAKSEADAVERQLELLDEAGRRAIETSRARGRGFAGRLPAIVAGNRHLFDVTDVASPTGSAGIACDVTAIEAAEAALRREIDFNARTLDHLATAVAIFGADRRLRSYNAAYRALFDLDAGFLDTMPDENAVLDRLRAGRKLPEQADFRSWRADVTAAYRAVETHEYWWHLPDGQTLRVLANPNPAGRRDLGLRERHRAPRSREPLQFADPGPGRDARPSQPKASRCSARTAGCACTIPSFAAIWNLPTALLDDGPHVSGIVARLPQARATTRRRGRRFTAAVAGLDETRARGRRRGSSAPTDG